LAVRRNRHVAEGWLDAADLTDEERRLIESRLEAHRRNPDAAIPWEDVEAELIARFGNQANCRTPCSCAGSGENLTRDSAVLP
jgi:hypothetical protein